jgi:PAS domain S-box-containing protein
LGGQPAVQVLVRDISDAKRLERELRTHNEYLEALHQMTLGLIRRLDPQEVLEAIVARAGALVGTEHGFVYLTDPDLAEMEVRVGVGTFSHWKGFRLARGEGVSGKVWEAGQAVVVEDYETWEERSPSFPKGVFHAVVAVPLQSGGDIVGVLGLAHVESGIAFGPEAVDMLDRFAELASIALDNARLYSEAQQELVERRRAEQALRFQAHLLDSVENAVVATDANDAISYWNAFAERLLGWKAEEVLGRHIRKFLRIPPEVLASVKEVTGTGRAWAGDFEIRRRDGSSFVAFGRVSPVHGPDGAREGLVGVFLDITDRRKTEEALRAAFEREKEVSKRLLAVDEMKTTFLEAVSHELRTPLSAILGLALTLERYDARFSPERTREMIGRLAVNARKLDRLLSDLLDLDRLSRGILKPRRRPTDISALVRQVVAGSDVVDSRPIQLQLADVIVPVEPAKVERIVENLVANAIRHTPEGTPIWVKVEEMDGGVVIAVEDAGPGVPKELRETIFEAFRQGADTRAATPGVGIGLSLVARFAELHGGRAWVEDREGGGASFKVVFPTTPPDTDPPSS